MDEITISKIKEIILTELKSFNYDILGVVDKNKNVYPMTSDTKVLSKIFEMVAIPHFKKIVIKLSTKENKCKVLLAKHQNQYPDLTLTGGMLGDNKIAIDIKSAYRIDDKKFSGFTLGAFNGYFKDRKSTKNILFPYENYSNHWILCFIYDRDLDTDITEFHNIENIEEIPIIINDVEVILQDKWKTATTRPGSGNTANIGGINNLQNLKDGKGDFTDSGLEVFDDYWMHYIRKEDCNKMKLPKQPFTNLTAYREWIKNGRVGDKEIETYYNVHKIDIPSESDK
ncbi:restriction endonuclease [archaeon]|jgi:hypothetical protein|nr:restriction endonuclease [archaeon]